MVVLSCVAVLAPLIPFALRFLIVARFFGIYFDEDDYDAGSPAASEARADTRALLPTLAGFSFSALLALVVVDAAAGIDLKFAVYYLMVSFLCYLVALNQVSYKFYRWQEELENALTESASLSLILAISTVVLTTDATLAFRYALAGLALGVWSVDHAVHLHVTLGSLKSEDSSKNTRTRRKADKEELRK